MERKKILLAINDSTISQRLISELTQYGYTVVHFQKGSKAIEFANSGLPDFMLAEIQLPDMDGIELCWIIRETSKVPDIPFMLLTDKDDPEIRINGFRSGADAFVVKPGSMREIVTRIETLIKRIDSSRKSSANIYHSLCGTIPDFSFMEILQILNTAKKSGTLTIKTTENVGKIGFLKGNLVWGEQDLLEGEAAIMEISQWNKAVFEFEKDLVFKKRNIHKPTMEIILNCCNLLDEKLAKIKKNG